MREFRGICDSFLGETALICAVKNRNFDVVQHLINRGASVNIADHAGHTALYYAILNRSEREVIAFLINSGAEIEETRMQVDEYAAFHKDFNKYWSNLTNELNFRQ